MNFYQNHVLGMGFYHGFEVWLGCNSTGCQEIISLAGHTVMCVS
jgi:hypothetical protein